MGYAARQTVSQDIKSLAYALLLHGLILAALLVNIYWPGNRDQRRIENIIEARVVLDQPTAAPPARRETPAPVDRAQDSARKAAQALARQKAVALEKKRAADKARKQAALEKKRRQQVAAKRRQQQAKQELQKALEAEERERTAQANEAKAMSAMAEFEGLIRQQVTRNWSKPSGVPAGLNCLVRVRLAAGGEVLAVSIVKSSGNELFDRSVENAVYKAAPLPVPEDPNLFKYIREINIRFDPED